MKVYGAMYNSMTEESSYGIISLHETKEGAEKALEIHKQKEYEKWEKHDKWVQEEYKEHYEVWEQTEFVAFRDWLVEEFDVFP